MRLAAMMQMLPIAAYFIAQKVCTAELLGGVVPASLLQYLGWLPTIIAGATYLISNHFSSQAAAAATAKLVGQEAPDFDCELLDGKKTTLMNLVKEKALPTVIDFYQSF